MQALNFPTVNVTYLDIRFHGPWLSAIRAHPRRTYVSLVATKHGYGEKLGHVSPPAALIVEVLFWKARIQDMEGSIHGSH
jgi:hypothetical protein